jgi:hypothetical protein
MTSMGKWFRVSVPSLVVIALTWLPADLQGVEPVADGAVHELATGQVRTVRRVADQIGRPVKKFAFIPGFLPGFN